jgi:subtilisin family serine protease
MESNMDGDVIYRLPRWLLGPEVYTANQLDDIVDWGLKANGIPAQWDVSKRGAGKTVAVLDTGRYTHKDIADPVFSYNFSHSSHDRDVQGHSTHVCGTIAALENGTGVVGVAPRANIGICKVLGDDGSGDNRGIMKGIYKSIDHKVDIISMSLGGGYDPGVEQAILDAVQSGIFVICAAGNDGKQGSRNTIGYPARLKTTIAVASYDRNGNISSYSSRGPQIDTAFPGEDILSTWPGDKFRRISGTSMATPFCSGLVALMLAANDGDPDFDVRNNSDLRKHLKDNSTDQGEMGKDNAWGWGIPDPSGVIRAKKEDDPVDPPPNDDDGDVDGNPKDSFNFFGFTVYPNTKFDGKEGLFVTVK